MHIISSTSLFYPGLLCHRKVCASISSPSSQVPIAACTCSGRCLFADVEYGRCEQHDIEMGETFGHHFCLKCEMFHCKKHFKVCCKKYGNSVMVRDSSKTLAQIRRRQEEIIRQWEAEVADCKNYVEQVKNRKFICSECRSKTCFCSLVNFKEYESKKQKRARRLEKLMQSRDLQVV